MKKILLTLLVLIVITGLVGPKFAGNSFNNQLDAFAEKISELPFYKASIENRQQGWFSTTASVVIGLDTAAFGNSLDNADQPDFSFTIPIEAQHGPLLTKSGLGLGWVGWQVNFALSDPIENLEMAEGSEFIYSADGTVSLFGAISYSDFMPALTYTNQENGMTFSTTGWQGDGRLTTDTLDYDSDKAISLAVSVQGMTLASIENISMHMDIESGLMQAWEQPLYDGIASFTVEAMRFTNPANGEEITLSNLVMDSETRFDESTELGDMVMSAKLASFNSNAIAMQDVQLDFELKNLQSHFFKAYQKLSEKMVNSPDQADIIMQSFMQESGLAQLQANPEMNLPVIKGTINESKIDGFAKAKLADIQALPDPLDNKVFWAEHAVVDSKLTIEEGAASFIAELFLKQQLAANPQFAQMSEEEKSALITQQSQATLNALVQQGMLVKVDAGYEFTFTMENAKALLNGNPMPLPLQ